MTNDSLALFKGDELVKSWRICEGLAKSTLIPKDFVGKPENVMIAVLVSQRFNIDPFTIMQNLGVINGRPTFGTQFLMALANQSGRFVGPIEWEVSGEGDTLAVTAWAVLSATNRRVQETVSMKLAKAEGWTRNAKYTTMPERMLKYRSASALIGLYASDVKMGFSTQEEEDDNPPIEAQVVPPPAIPDLATKELGEPVQVTKRGRVPKAALASPAPVQSDAPAATVATAVQPDSADVFKAQAKAQRQSLLSKREAEIYTLKLTPGNENKIDAIRAEQKEILLLTDEEIMAYEVF